MQPFTLNEGTANKRYFKLFLVDATDMKTPETGEAGGQPQISINGGTWANTSAVLVHVGNGHYYVALTVVEVSSLGSIAVRYVSANTVEFQDVGVVQTELFAPAVSLEGVYANLRLIMQKINWIEYMINESASGSYATKELTVL